jgi:EmrB/QacA subfamily drug resistance transporter
MNDAVECPDIVPLGKMVTARALFVERPPLPALARSAQYRWLVVGTVCVGAFLGQLDASIAGLILPTLEEVFGASLSSVEWVAISYLLTLAILVVPFGRLADLVGRKTMYTTGFVVFIVGSALCGASPSLGWLILFRVFQAVGAALLQSNSVAIITAAVDRRSLGRAIGVQGAAQAVGLAVGPSVGGLLIGALGWRWVFYIAVPFGLLGTLLGFAVLPQTRHRTEPAAVRERFDWLGALLFAPAVGFVMLALTFGNDWGWTSPRVIATLVLTVASLVAFGLVERRADSPLVDFVVLRDRVFATGIVAGLLSYAVLFGSLFLFPFYLERILGNTPSETGLLLSPVPIAIGVLAPISGIVADKVGSRLPTVVGMVVSTAALLTLAFRPAAAPAFLAIVLLTVGAGLGFFTPANNSAIMGSAPPHRLGVAGGILNMTRSLGTSLGVAATGLVLTARLAAHAGHPVEGTLDVPLPALVGAFRDALIFLAIIGVVAAVISTTRGKRAEHPVELDPELRGETTAV